MPKVPNTAGLAQQVRKNRSLPQRLSVQKTPKGATGLARQRQKRQHQTVRAKTNYNHTSTAQQNKPDKVHNAFAHIYKRGHTTSSYKPLHIQARAHNFIIQASTYISEGTQLHHTSLYIYKRGHHTLHRLNLRNNSHLPVIK
jgi:fumarate hydratase class II